jgi:hypothetical protein
MKLYKTGLIWYDAEKIKPNLFDLCLLDTGSKIITGWWTGQTWDGANYSNEHIKKWKRLIM